MSLLDALRGMFHPRIVREYDEIIIKYNEAVKRWNNNSGLIDESSLKNYCLSFVDKKIIVSHKSEILEINDEIRRDDEIRREREKYYDRIKREFPLGFKYFGQNNIDEVLSNVEKIKTYQDICSKYEGIKEHFPLGLAAFKKAHSLADGKNDDILTIKKNIEYEDEIRDLETRERSKLEEEKRKAEEFYRLFDEDEASDEEEEYVDVDEEEEYEDEEEEEYEEEEYDDDADEILIDDTINSITHFTTTSCEFVNSRGNIKKTDELRHYYWYNGGWESLKVEDEYKDDADEILKILKRKKVKCFYHFTSRENLSSIKELGGLFSWHYLKSHGIEIPDQGGTHLSEQLDRRYRLQDYVRLSLCERHPMAYRKEQEGADIVILKISIDVATLKNTKFSDMNATDNLHSQGNDAKALKKINFAATKRKYVRNDGPDFKYMQAEIMVKTFLPIKYILNIDSL